MPSSTVLEKAGSMIFDNNSSAKSPFVVRSIEVPVGAEAPFAALFLADTHFFWEERFSPTATQIVCPGTYAGEALELRFA